MKNTPKIPPLDKNYPLWIIKEDVKHEVSSMWAGESKAIQIL
jgi:hypothetical protein